MWDKLYIYYNNNRPSQFSTDILQIIIIKKTFDGNTCIIILSGHIKATKLQGALLPALGAVFGGVVGGPVGMLAGFKAAAVLTAVGGGVLGYGATNYIKQKRDKAVDSELEKLTDTNSDKER